MQNQQNAFRLALLGAVLGVVSAHAQTDTVRFESKVLPVLASQCFQCHGEQVQSAGVNFAVFRNGAAAAEKPELWSMVREKIADHLMPPPPLAGLSAADAAAVTGWIDSVTGAPKTASAPNPGRVTARRLNRLEFNNTIRDFLGITVHPADDFPIDNQGYGFDNIGDVLTLSPMLMEKYMAAARSLSHIAVYGEAYEKKPGLVGKLLTKSVQDDGQVSGNVLPFSMRGDLEGVFHFPVEADYILQFRITNRRGLEPGVDISPNGDGGAGAAGGRGGRGGAGAGRGGPGGRGGAGAGQGDQAAASGRGGAGAGQGDQAAASGRGGAGAGQGDQAATGGRGGAGVGQGDQAATGGRGGAGVGPGDQAASGRGGAGQTAAAGGRGGGGFAGGRGGGRGPRAPLTEEEKKARLEADRIAAPPVELNVDVDGHQVLKYLVEGNEAFAYTRGPTVVKIHVTAGDHTIHAYLPANADLDDPRTNLNPRDGRRRLAAEFVEIIGPYDPSPARPASYGKVFICATHDAVCARKIVESLARRGFRRPPTEAETDRLLKLVAMVQKQGDSFDEGIRIALESILVSPAFLFRIERDPASAAGTYHVSDYELASRLSYFLWSSMPDDELLKAAEQHRLGQSAVLEAQVKRMLQDPKAANLVDDFAVQWLDLRALDRRKPDAVKFPTVDDELLAAMRRETLLFVGEIFRQDRSLLDLIDGKFTYVNGPLARYYGIKGVDGVNFQRVSLDGTERGGILTQAAVLTMTSYATRTSPVIRGKWVLNNLLGTPPPPPPPDVPALEEKNLGTDASVRERLEQHRANAACAVCHKQMDPIGFGLENFDAAGGFRTKDGKFDVDSSGTLPDGRSFEGVSGLRSVLKSQSGLFTRNLSEKMLTFALGRGIESSDRAVVDQINQRLTANGNKLSALAMAIVESEPFQMRKKEEVLHASR